MSIEQKISICFGQIEVAPGLPRVNTEKMLKYIKEAKDKASDLLIFPELCIPGYLLGDMWERPDFLEDCEECGKKIIEASQGITIAFGNVKTDPKNKNEDGRIRKYNCCFIASNGQLVTTVTKTLQPNYREFDDNRHFYDKRKQLADSYLSEPSTKVSFSEFIDKAYEPSLTINGIKIGFLLCEDAWDTDYSFSPIDVLAPKCDLIVNMSCSPFTMGKNQKRNRLFSQKAKNNNVMIAYINNVGIQNNGKTIYTFDGNSCIYDIDGMQYDFLSPFEEGLEVLSLGLDAPLNEEGAIGSLKDGIEDLYISLCYGIDKFLKQIGVNKVVIGVSGGIDSAVVASLFAEILPAENIYLINMPSSFNSQTTRDLAKDLAKNLGCKYSIIPIGCSIDHTRDQLLKEGFDVSQFVFENIQARDRSSRILAAIASSVGGVFTCNANKSEATVGYTTLYGDLGGFMSPLADVWKTDVYRLAKYINDNSNDIIIPHGILTVKPSAELSNDQNVEEGKGDPIIYPYHDLLFRSWVEKWDRATPADILQWVIDYNLEEKLGFEDGDIVAKYFGGDKRAFVADLERWWNLYDGFAYAKRVQAPPILAVSRRSYGFDHRESLTAPFYSQKYYKLRMQYLGGDLTMKEVYANLKTIKENVIFVMAKEAGLDMGKFTTKDLALKGFMSKIYDLSDEDMVHWE